MQLRDEKQRICDSLKQQRLDMFMAGFSAINSKLKEVGGGGVAV
jgi:chromosome segregation ATPase